MYWLLLACNSPDPECATDEVLRGDRCVPAKDDTTDSTPGDDTGDSTDTTGTTPTCAVTAIAAEPLGDVVNNARVHLELGEAAEVELACTLTTGPSAPVSWLGPDAPWRWWDGDTVADGWESPDHDDEDWSEGSAPLGYGESVATDIDYGPDADDKRIAAWFRVHLEVRDPTEVRRPILTVGYDDGLAAWLNGVEVGRWNLPEGELGPDTLALESTEPTEATVSLDPGLFTAGDNVFAFALHQADPGTSDAWMDASLTLDGAPATPDPAERLVVPAGYGDTFDVDVRGLLAGAGYACAPTCDPTATVAVHTDPLPEGVPSFRTEGTPPTPGYVLLNSQEACVDNWAMWLLLVDSDGRVRWYEQAEGLDSAMSTDVESILLPDDTVLWGGGDDPDAVPQTVDLDGRTTWRSSYPGVEDDVYHHDVVYTADGWVAGIIQAPVTTSSGRSVTSFGIVEQDPATDTERWRWESQTAYDAGTLSTAGRADDPWHANGLASTTDADGPAYYVNLFYDASVVRIDRTTGEHTWTFGRDGDFTLLDEAGDPAPDADWFTAAHSVHAIDANRISLYDNGDSSAGSRMIVYELDAAARTARVVAEWGDGWYNATWGDGDQLADDLWLVNQSAASCTGGDSGSGRIVLANPVTGETLWRMRFEEDDDSSYRSAWVDGCRLFGNEKYCRD